MKIIQILHNSPSFLSSNIWEDVYDGWHVRTAKAILSQTKRFKIECWVPERTLRKTHIEQKDGITYKVFPSFALAYGRECSTAIIDEIKKISKQEDVILHLHGVHNWLTYSLARKFRNLPIVAQQHGDCPPMHLIERRKLLVFGAPLLTAEQIIERNSLKNIDHFFVISKADELYLRKFVDSSKISFQTIGVDFDVFRPTNKKLARQKLGLPDKKIMLYVGRFIKNKGCHIVLDAYKKLKKYYDVELVMVGGSQSDELYHRVKESGAIIFGHTEHNLLPLFYNAADVFVMPGSKFYNMWGVGGAVAPMEALACGTPVISASLINIPPSDRSSLGVLPKNFEDIVAGTRLIFENPHNYKNCRILAKKYFSWEKIAKNTLEIYQKLFSEYYG